MLGFYAGLVIAAILAVLLAMRPVMARMGWGYAVERRKQLALVVVGLMVGTTVIAAAGIAADSSGESFSRSVTSRIALTDALVWSWSNRATSVESAQQIVEDPQLAPHIESWSLALRAELGFEAAATGIGSNDASIWGIDPATFSRTASWEAKEGVAPMSLEAWAPNGIVLNDRAAKEYGLGVGDEATLFLAGTEIIAAVDEVFAGHIVASRQLPVTTGFEDDGYVHHPNDVYSFTWNKTTESFWDQSVSPAVYRQAEFHLRTDPANELLMVVEMPNGEEFVAATDDGEAQIVFDHEQGGWPVGSLFDNRVHGDVDDVAFTVTARGFEMAESSADVIPVQVIGVIEQDGSEPVRGGAAIYLGLPALHDILAIDGVDTLLVDFKEGANLQELRRPFEELARTHMSGFGELPLLELEEWRREIELATAATFLGFGSFSIIAGFMLIGVLMALLVEERKRLIATTRAVGATRGNVTEAMSHEGSIYALLASFVGLVSAVGLAGMLMRVGESLLSSENIEAVLIVRIGTILTAIGSGFATTMLVMSIAAYRATRLQVAAALRGHEVEPRRGKVVRWVVTVLLLGVGVIYSLLGVAGDNVGLVVGPCLLAFGLLGLLGRNRARNLVYTVIGASLSVYIIASFWFITPERDVDFILFPVRAVLLPITLGVVVAYSSWVHRFVVAAFARIKGAGPVIDAALAHLRERPGRSALTVIMFAVVLVMLTALGTMFATFAPNDLGDAGGFDILADTAGAWETSDGATFDNAEQFLRDNPPRSGIDPFENIERHTTTPMVFDALDQLYTPLPEGQRGYGYVRGAPWIANAGIGVTSEFAQMANFQEGHHPGYPSVKAALAAVAQDPSLAILSDLARIDVYQHDGDFRDLPDIKPKVGERWALGDENGVYHNITVIGTIEGTGAGGIFLHPDALALVSENHHWGAGVRIWVESDGDPEAVVTELESAFRRVSLEAYEVDNINEEEGQVMRAFQFIISLFMGLGILIGMVSLSLIMGRNVMLRKSEIGMFRAMGATPGQITTMFGFEALYLTGFSIIIGFSIGIMVAARMLAADGGELFDLRIDWGGLAILYGITLAAAVLTAFFPAWKASRIPPAEAVRYVE